MFTLCPDMSNLTREALHPKKIVHPFVILLYGVYGGGHFDQNQKGLLIFSLRFLKFWLEEVGGQGSDENQMF